MKEFDTRMQDHINTFDQIVYQLLNVDEKLLDEEEALLHLVSLPKGYRNIDQTFIIRKESITLD